ncbi:MAG: FGGY family carbohydrate kinase [Bacilli bacterium]
MSPKSCKSKTRVVRKDYVRYLVTGVAATDYIEAQGTLFFDMKKMRWSRDLFALSGLDFSALPELVKPSDIVGKVSRQASFDTGIPEGTPVVCGASDSAVEDYGAGAIEPGDCILKLATAGNVNIMTSSPRPSGTTLTYSHIIGGMWYAVSATNAAALCQRWFRDAFCAEEKNAALALKRNAFDIMDALAGNSGGRWRSLFPSVFAGERSPYWDPDLRASFTGVSISSTKEISRAILEGVAFSLRDCYGSLESAGLKARRFFLIGGGARSSL